MHYVIEDFQGTLDILLKLMRHHEMSATNITLTPLCQQLETAVRTTPIPSFSQAGEEACQLTYIASAKITRLQTLEEAPCEESPLNWLEGIDQFAQMRELAHLFFQRQNTTLGCFSRGLPLKESTQKRIRLASLEDLKRHFEKIRLKENNRQNLVENTRPEEGPSLEEVMEETSAELKKNQRLEMEVWLAHSSIQTCIGRFLAILELFKQEKILLYICDSEDKLWIYPQTSEKAP